MHVYGSSVICPVFCWAAKHRARNNITEWPLDFTTQDLKNNYYPKSFICAFERYEFFYILNLPHCVLLRIELKLVFLKPVKYQTP